VSLHGKKWLGKKNKKKWHYEKILVHLKKFGPIHIINWGTCFVFANEEIIGLQKLIILPLNYNLKH